MGQNVTGCLKICYTDSSINFHSLHLECQQFHKSRNDTDIPNTFSLKLI
jgi:hypothetical protein